MHLVLDELVGTLEEFCRENDNRCGAITNLTVLDLAELDQNFGSGVSHLQLLKNCSAIIRNSYITNIIDEHLVKTLRAEGALNNVSETCNGKD